MKIRYFMACVLLISTLTFNAGAGEPRTGALLGNNAILIAAIEPSVTILSPKNGETVGPTVELKWKLEKANKAAHVHLYIDGKNQGPKQGDEYTLKDLRPGKHTIELHPATASHNETGVAGIVQITVK